MKSLLHLWPLALLIVIVVGLMGCSTRVEVHHYRVTDLTTGKVFIAETNNLSKGDPNSRDFWWHLGSGCSFTLHDGTWVQLDGSASCQPID